jgi:hypothetical protein
MFLSDIVNQKYREHVQQLENEHYDTAKIIV